MAEVTLFIIDNVFHQEVRFALYVALHQKPHELLNSGWGYRLLCELEEGAGGSVAVDGELIAWGGAQVSSRVKQGAAPDIFTGGEEDVAH